MIPTGSERNHGPMAPLSLLHGTLGVAILCLLIFAEETGVPLPLVPGDVLLVVGGILIANGSISPWSYLPAITTAAIAGAVCAYGWARLVGAGTLRSLAARAHATRHLARAERTLDHLGAPGVTVGRCIPGMRVFTSLLAGALHMRLRAMVAGAVPAVVGWVAVMTALGVFVGVPVENFLTAFGQVAMLVGGALIAALVTALAARTLSRRLRRRPLGVAPGAWLPGAAPTHRAA